jgi:hypothetical protein
VASAEQLQTLPSEATAAAAAAPQNQRLQLHDALWLPPRRRSHCPLERRCCCELTAGCLHLHHSPFDSVVSWSSKTKTDSHLLPLHGLCLRPPPWSRRSSRPESVPEKEQGMQRVRACALQRTAFPSGRRTVLLLMFSMSNACRRLRSSICSGSAALETSKGEPQAEAVKGTPTGSAVRRHSAQRVAAAGQGRGQQTLRPRACASSAGAPTRVAKSPGGCVHGGRVSRTCSRRRRCISRTCSARDRSLATCAVTRRRVPAAVERTKSQQGWKAQASLLALCGLAERLGADACTCSRWPACWKTRCASRSRDERSGRRWTGATHLHVLQPG